MMTHKKFKKTQRSPFYLILLWRPPGHFQTIRCSSKFKAWAHSPAIMFYWDLHLISLWLFDALILVCKYKSCNSTRLYWDVRAQPVIIVCRIIEEEREVRRQRPQSFMGSDAKEDSKVISHQRNYLHLKVILEYSSKKTTSTQKLIDFEGFAGKLPLTYLADLQYR